MPKEKEKSMKEEEHEEQDDDFIVNDDESVDETEADEDEDVGMGELLASFLCTQEDENLAEVCKGIREEMQSLNKNLVKLLKKTKGE
jgi:transcription termination factor NusB